MHVARNVILHYNLKKKMHSHVGCKMYRYIYNAQSYRFSSFNGRNELYYQLIKKYNIKKQKGVIHGMQNDCIHLYINIFLGSRRSLSILLSH